MELNIQYNGKSVCHIYQIGEKRDIYSKSYY